MDGVLIAVASSGVAIIGVMAGGFWKLSSRISDHSGAIGRLEGKVDGLCTGMENFQSQLNERVGRLDKRINGITSKKSRGSRESK